MEWTIKQTAEKMGIPADTLRYYDKEGIISPKRSENGYRQYSDNDISTLKNIIVMRYAHFSLAEMKSIEELFKHAPSVDCNKISRGFLNAKITELRQAICNYQKIVTLMEELIQMIGSVDAYITNKDRIDAFISQIFDDIRGGSVIRVASPPTLNRNEVE